MVVSVPADRAVGMVPQPDAASTFVQVQAYRFALDVTATQQRQLFSHCGAARVAFNVMLAAVKANLGQRAAERSYGIADVELTPSLGWSAYTLRKQFNQVKDVVAPWWPTNSKEAYATGCANLAAALTNWAGSRKSTSKGGSVGFPRFRSRRRATPSCTFTTGTIRVEPDRHHVTLPVIGRLKTYESTRKLARRVEAGTARVTTATISFTGGRWFVSFLVHVHRVIGSPPQARVAAAVVGIDLGLKDLLVVADAAGREVQRITAPRHLRKASSRMRALQRKAARQVSPWDTAARTRREPSAGWRHTQHKIRRLHTKIANTRLDLLHKATTNLARTHAVIGVETLAVKNMSRKGGARKRGLNRSFSDAALGTMLRLLEYKTAWYGSTLVKADRFYPSSKTCSNCGSVKTKLTLAQRQYECDTCGLILDRDLNAAINLAHLAQANTAKPGSSGGLDSGGADQKTRTPVLAGGVETATPATTGTASPQGEAA